VGIDALALQRVRRSLAFGRVARPEDDCDALLTQLPGDLQPDTFVRARDQGDLLISFVNAATRRP